MFLPLISVLVVFAFWWHLMTETEKRLQKSIDRRLRAIEYLDSKDQVEAELVKLAGEARTFIAATGGRGDKKVYLSTIEMKVRSGDVDYWRIFLGEEITHEMCEHVSSLLSLPNVAVTRLANSDYGNMLVVDTGLIVALPVPGRGGLMGLKVPNAEGAQRVFRYLMLVSQRAAKVTSDDGRACPMPSLQGPRNTGRFSIARVTGSQPNKVLHLSSRAREELSCLRRHLGAARG